MLTSASVGCGADGSEGVASAARLSAREAAREKGEGEGNKEGRGQRTECKTSDTEDVLPVFDDVSHSCMRKNERS